MLDIIQHCIQIFSLACHSNKIKTDNLNFVLWQSYLIKLLATAKGYVPQGTLTSAPLIWIFVSLRCLLTLGRVLPATNAALPVLWIPCMGSGPLKVTKSPCLLLTKVPLRRISSGDLWSMTGVLWPEVGGPSSRMGVTTLSRWHVQSLVACSSSSLTPGIPLLQREQALPHAPSIFPAVFSRCAVQSDSQERKKMEEEDEKVTKRQQDEGWQC